MATFPTTVRGKKQYAVNPVLFLSNGLANLTIFYFSGIYQ
jgi:hypothetical protein